MLKKTFATTLAGAALVGTTVFATGCATDTAGEQTSVISPAAEHEYAAASESAPQIVLAAGTGDEPTRLAASDTSTEPEDPAEFAASDDTDSLETQSAPDLHALLATVGAHVQEDGYALDVRFDTGSASLNAASSLQLQELAESLQAFPELTIRLEGHADRRGRAEMNLALSERRALAVHDALIAAGVPAERMQLVPLGEQQAAAKPGDADGLALDRRVTVHLNAPPARDAELAVHY